MYESNANTDTSTARNTAMDAASHLAANAADKISSGAASVSAAASDAMDDAVATSRRSLDTLNDYVVANPVTAALASAAAGAGIIALLTLLGRDDRSVSGRVNTIGSQLNDQIAQLAKAAKPARRAASSYADTAIGTYSNLRDQIGDLAARVAAALPSKSDAQDAADKLTSNTGDKASDAWDAIRDQAQSIIEQVRPQVGAATDLARANPIWTAVAAGVLGALIGSQMMSSNSKD